MTISLLKTAQAPVHIDGQVHPDFQEVGRTLQRQLHKSPGGAAVCVYHRGECVADLWGGSSDGQGRPWLRDTMSPSFSTTKGVAATLLHIYADRGLIEYHAPVAEYWPEFAQAGKAAITVRQVLAHQSGLYHIRQMVDCADRMLDWEHMIKAIEQTEPAHVPGARTGYHGLTFGYLVGEIIQRVTGGYFPDLVQTEIADPLGLDGLYIGTPDAQIPRAAELLIPEATRRLSQTAFGAYLEKGAAGASRLMQRLGQDTDLVSLFDALAPSGISTFDFGSPECLRAAIPAGNGLFTARSLARMYAMLANGGELDGTRILSKSAVNRASTLQKPTGRHSVIPFDMRWRLGYHSVITTRGMPRRAFGHFGFGGSGAWADPERDLAVALVVNSGLGSPFGDVRTARMSAAAITCADARTRREQRLLKTG